MDEAAEVHEELNGALARVKSLHMEEALCKLALVETFTTS